MLGVERSFSLHSHSKHASFQLVQTEEHQNPERSVKGATEKGLQAAETCGASLPCYRPEEQSLPEQCRNAPNVAHVVAADHQIRSGHVSGTGAVVTPGRPTFENETRRPTADTSFVQPHASTSYPTDVQSRS